MQGIHGIYSECQVMPIVTFKCFKFMNASLSDIKIKSIRIQRDIASILPARPGFSPGCLFLSCIFIIKFGTLDSVFPWSDRTPLPLSAEWYIPRGMLAISSFTSDVANSSKAKGEEGKKWKGNEGTKRKQKVIDWRNQNHPTKAEPQWLSGNVILK